MCKLPLGYNYGPVSCVSADILIEVGDCVCANTRLCNKKPKGLIVQTNSQVRTDKRLRSMMVRIKGG